MEFFVEKKIRIYQGETEKTLTLRPLLIKELPSLIRLMVEIKDMDPADQVAAQVEMLRACITPAAFFVDLPAVDVLPAILDAFFELNFPSAQGKKKGAKPAGEVIDDRDFAKALDFLISQGHVYSEIQEYTLPQFTLFQELAVERLTGKRKKRVDPLAALAAAGIQVGSK